MFFIIYLDKRSKFLFHFFNYSFVWILKYYFCWNLQTTLLQIGRVSFWTCNFTPNFPSMLNKKGASFDINFGRWPTVTDSLLINLIAYLSWTKECGSSSLEHPKMIWNMISTNTAIHSKNKFSFLSFLSNKLFNYNIFIVPCQGAGKTFLSNFFLLN